LVKINSFMPASINVKEPGARSSNVSLPMAYRISLKVGKPVAAVIFLTCLFLPSVSVSDIHEVGMFLRKRTGGFLSETLG